MTPTPDPDLIAAHLAGDRRAFAAIYDRYAPALYDVARGMTRNPDDAADLVHDTFVIAAQRLGQLRQPERLRPWLFAVLRHEVYRAGRRRGRERPTELVAEMVPPSVPDPGAALERESLAALVREAAGGLDDRDRLVLELVARQRLEGDELAGALGVTVAQTYSLVHRMRQRFTRAAGAAVVARTGRAACTELDRVLTSWDGRYDVLTRKRVARHVDDCTICQDTRSKAGLLDLFGATPASALPGGLRERVLADAFGTVVTIALDADGFPRARRRRSPALLAVAAVAAVLLAAGLGAAFVRPASGPDLGAPVGGTVGTTGGGTGATTSGSAVASSAAPTSGSSGATTTSGPSTTAAPTTTTGAAGVGDPPAADPPAADPSDPSGPTGPTTGPATPVTTVGAGALQPPAPDPPAGPTDPTGTRPTSPPTAPPTVAPPRTTGPRLVAPTTSTTVPLPQIRIGDPATTAVFVSGGSCAPTSVTISATVLQAVTGIRVVLAWTGPDGTTGTRGMTAGTGSSWSATLGPFTTAGTVSYTVTATNPGRPAVTSSPRTITVRPCAR